MAIADTPRGGEPKLGATPPQRARRSGLRRWAARVPAPLTVILLAAALQSIAWNLSVAPFQGPDETAHYAYIQYLAETGHLPHTPSAQESEALILTPGSTEEQEVLTWLNLRPTIGNFLGRPAWTGADLSLWHQVERSLPHGSRTKGAERNQLAKNPPLYYAVMAIPYRVFIWLPVLKRVFVLRLVNSLFYLATIVLMWLLAGVGEVGRQRSLAQSRRR